jgi:NAD(P)-dependent dehydrogenase (short-subunit alcohol dehydrogenase family)
MDLQLQGKRAVITGGSRGIGKAIARRLALEGCDVAICARNEGPLQETANELRRETGRKVYAAVCDTMSAEDIKGFIDGAAQALGGIEILVNNAAAVGGTGGGWDTVQDTNLLHDFEEKVVGYFRAAKAAVPYMQRAGWGRIVNVSGNAGRAPGNAVSGGIRNVGTVNLAKSLANALGQYGITANAVYPGGTLTERGLERYAEQARRENTTVEALLAQAAERSPNRHVNTAEDIANVVAFLCSPLSVGIQGEAIGVTGGQSTDVHY